MSIFLIVSTSQARQSCRQIMSMQQKAVIVYSSGLDCTRDCCTITDFSDVFISSDSEQISGLEIVVVQAIYYINRKSHHESSSLYSEIELLPILGLFYVIDVCVSELVISTQVRNSGTHGIMLTSPSYCQPSL